MNKFKIGVRETIELKHEITIETDKSIEEVDSFLNKLSREATALDDMEFLLKNYDCEVVEICEDDGGDSEIEIDDLYEVE